MDWTQRDRARYRDLARKERNVSEPDQPTKGAEAWKCCGCGRVISDDFVKRCDCWTRVAFCGKEQKWLRAQPASGLAEDAGRIVEALHLYEAFKYISNDKLADVIPLAGSLAGKIEAMEARLAEQVSVTVTMTDERNDALARLATVTKERDQARNALLLHAGDTMSLSNEIDTMSLSAEEDIRILQSDLDEARKKIEVMEREREELRECLDASRRFAIIHGKLQRKEATEAAEAQLSAFKAENADLKTSVIAFLAPWAVEYQADFGLDGLHPTHYDILEKCGARMVDFDRASLVVPSVGKTP